ncbi:hypothetical protein PENTCL1PPCAC_12372, partial [Pristionchus entomophagus]
SDTLAPPTRPTAHPTAPTTRPAAPPSTTQHTTSQPARPSAPPAATTSAPPATSSFPIPPTSTSTQQTQQQTHPPATSSAPAPSSPAAETAATSPPAQQQPPAPIAAAAATQPPSPATVQWWTPTPAAPAAAQQEHHEEPTTAAPLPPVAMMRTFPTESLPKPVTVPTLKSEPLTQIQTHSQDRPMHESTTGTKPTTQQTHPTTLPGTKPSPIETTQTNPSTRPSTPTTIPGMRFPIPTEPAQITPEPTEPNEATTVPGTKPAETDATTEQIPTEITKPMTTSSKPTEASKVPGTVPVFSEPTKPTTSTDKPTQATSSLATTDTTKLPSEPRETSETKQLAQGKPEPTEATEGTSTSTGKPSEATTEPTKVPDTREPVVSMATTEPGTTAPEAARPKTKEEEEADDLSLDDLISAIEDGLNEEEKKKLDASKEKSAEVTTTEATTTTATSSAAPATSSSTTKSELESELEHELSKELEETSELADELSKTLSKELAETTSDEELADEVSKALSKELKSEETDTSELADELSKTLSKELLKSEETELEKTLSTELEKNIEDGKSIETLIHEGEEAFEKLEKEKTTEKPEVTEKPATSTTAPVTEPGHEEMPFEGKDVFEMEGAKANVTEKPKEEEEKKPTSECSAARNLTDTTKADVLFLLDSSTSFDEQKFKGALEFIANTTGHFQNIGPDGVQVSLIQFASEPQLEFSLRRHNCLPTLIEDIKGTEYMKGHAMLGHAIDKATRLAFTRERGDRPEAENLLIVVTDGATEDKVQQPVTVAKENGVDVLVISTMEADPKLLLELAGSVENIFEMDGKISEPLSTRLAQRICDSAAGYRVPPEQRFPTLNENKDESAEEKKKEKEEGVTKPKEEGSTTAKPSTTLMSGEVMQEMLPPPRNLKLACTRKSMGINIELPGAFHGWLFIEGQREKDNCSMKVEKDADKDFRLVHFEAGIEECDIAHIQSETPAGINSSAVVSIVKHPKAVSIDDKAFLLECFVASALETTLDAHLEVVGGIKKTIAEAFSLDVVPPKCHYTIRKGSPEGVKVEKADLGEIVYHRWDCDGGDEAYDVFGMHIHDCYASSDVEQQFPIVDKNGCSSNTNLLAQPVYAEGALSVYAESRAFAVENDQQDLKFQCKVSLCTRDGDGCEGITPPHCSGNGTDLLVSRRLRHNQAVDSALTSAVATSVGLTTAALSRYSPGLVVLIAIILATMIGLISAVRLKSCRSRSSSSRPIVTSPSMEEIYVTVPGRSSIKTTPPNPAMSDFMKDFDRSRYV